MSGRGAERKGDTKSKGGSAQSPVGGLKLTNHEIMT